MQRRDDAHVVLYSHTKSPHKSLLHDNNSAQSLERLDNLLSLILWHALLHELGSALNKLLAVDKRKTEQTLDLLDDLWLARRLERLKLKVEQCLFLRGRGCLLFFNGCCCCWSGGGRGESTYGQVWDVEAGLLSVRRTLLKSKSAVYSHLEGRNKVGGFQKSQLADLVDNGGDLWVGGSIG